MEHLTHLDRLPFKMGLDQILLSFCKFHKFLRPFDLKFDLLLALKLTLFHKHGIF